MRRFFLRADGRARLWLLPLLLVLAAVVLALRLVFDGRGVLREFKEGFHDE